MGTERASTDELAVVVTVSNDLAYFGSLIGTAPGLLAPPAIRLFLVTVAGVKSGGFLIVNHADGRRELHTKLEHPCRGRDVLEAGKQLASLLRRAGVKKVTTFATHDNRLAKIMAVKNGFVRTGSDNEKVYYERELCP